MRTIEELRDDLENARGGGNTGDIETAAMALEEGLNRELRFAAECVVATVFGNDYGLSMSDSMEAIKFATEQLKDALSR